MCERCEELFEDPHILDDDEIRGYALALEAKDEHANANVVLNSFDSVLSYSLTLGAPRDVQEEYDNIVSYARQKLSEASVNENEAEAVPEQVNVANMRIQFAGYGEENPTIAIATPPTHPAWTAGDLIWEVRNSTEIEGRPIEIDTDQVEVAAIGGYDYDDAEDVHVDDDDDDYYAGDDPEDPDDPNY